MHSNKNIYIKLRKLLATTNVRLAALIGEDELTTKSWGNPSNRRRPQDEQLKQCVVEFYRPLAELQRSVGLKPTTMAADLELLAEKLVKKLREQK